MGVVKTPALFIKNSAQHLADLETVSNNEYSKAAFINPTTDKRNEIASPWMVGMTKVPHI